MNELWDIAIQPHNLPLTCVVGLFMVYWLSCIVGIFGIDSMELDLDADVGMEGSDGVFVSFLRFVNATDVPLMAILTLISVFMWVITMMGNYYFNSELNDFVVLAIFGASFLISAFLTKVATAPLVPVFRKMKELEKAEPAIGRSGFVISKQVDQKYGQVEISRKEGAPAILNCRVSGSEPILRGEEVLVISYDKPSGIYLVNKI